MKYRYDGDNWLLRLDIGEKLKEQLTNLIKKENIPSAWVSGIGAAQSAEIGYYDLVAKEYRFRKLSKVMEIASLAGNVTFSGNEPVLHLHIVLSDENLHSYGGHLRDLEAAGTVELFLRKWNGEPLARAYDEATGLSVLNL